MKRFKDWKPPVFDEDGWAYQEVTPGGYRHPYGWSCQYPENLVLGEDCDIGCFTYINAKHGVEIGANTQIGSHCSIYSESTIDGKKGKIMIGIGSKIGSHSVIMPGVTIQGCHAIIASCSFVNRDVSGGEMVGGVPIQSIKELHESQGFEDNCALRIHCVKCDHILYFYNNKIVRGKVDSYFTCHTCGFKIKIRRGDSI